MVGSRRTRTIWPVATLITIIFILLYMPVLQPKWNLGISIVDICNSELPERQQNPPDPELLSSCNCSHILLCNCSTSTPNSLHLQEDSKEKNLQVEKSLDTLTSPSADSGTSQVLNITLPREECERHWYPSGHWTRRATEPAINVHQTGGRQMYGSVPAQHAIWRLQHPSNCHNKKFIVLRGTGGGHGIGSAIHMTGVVLKVALDLDRVLVMWPQPTGEWIHGPYCEGFPTLDSCYFEPISSCAIHDAMGSSKPSEEAWDGLPWLDESSYHTNSGKVLREDLVHFGLSFLVHETPVMFHKLLTSGNMSKSFYYWWRAQASAYIVRPNVRTLLELDRRRGLVFGGEDIEEGTVSMHVRHGDKWKEMTLADDATYLKAVEELLAIDEQPKALKRNIFLSTEDAATVEFFSTVKNWTTRWTNVSRVSDSTTSPISFAVRIGWNEEFLNSLLSLQLALECDAWVGQIPSNWCRLIDEPPYHQMQTSPPLLRCHDWHRHQRLRLVTKRGIKSGPK